MKKIFLFISALFALSALKAQNPTFSPGTFTADDQVTLTVDVSGTPMAGQTSAYIWIWANPGGSGPAKDGSVNTSWTNSPAAAKMTAAGTNKWSYTFTGTTLFGLTPGELHDFGFLIKAQDGSKQTADFKPFSFDPLIFVPSMLRIFPSKVDRDDVVTMNFEKALGSTNNETRMTPTSATVTMYDETGAVVGNPLTIAAHQSSAGIWSASFIPNNAFTPGSGHKLLKFIYHFNGTVLDTNGNPQTVTSSDATVTFVDMK